MYWRGKKPSKPKPQKQSEDNIIKRKKKKMKQLKIESLKILRPFFNKKMIIVKQ